ncbi:hypothetical protein AC1031_009506 [Aphanomyces cochlioides]|nr:hypothetical protein AC1031_009506 [Aphanomyces cochlioides]
MLACLINAVRTTAVARQFKQLGSVIVDDALTLSVVILAKISSHDKLKMALRRATTRLESALNIHLRRVLSKPTLLLVRVKHVVCAVYFGTLGAAYLIVDAGLLRTTDAYAPRVVGAITLAFALLHLYGLVLTWWPHNTNLFGSLFSCRWKWRVSLLQLAMAHFSDLAAQIYQAYNMSLHLVDTRVSFVFALVLSLSCLLSPWLLLVQNAFLRRSLLLLVDSYFGFFLSTGFPFVLLFLYSIRMVFLHPNLQNDMPSVTVNQLFLKYLLIGSPVDLVTKVIIQCTSYTSVRRLFVTMRVSRKVAHSPLKAPLSPLAPLRSMDSPDCFLLFHFGLTFLKSRRRAKLYLVVHLIIGTALLSSAVVATWWRRPCPSSCLLTVAPWFDLSCHCVYVDLNCASSQLPGGDTIDAFLHPDEIGTDLFMLHVKRCRLLHGISLRTLEPFQKIYGIAIYFSNMTQWNLEPALALPDSLRFLHIRGSNLTQVPDVLRRVSMNFIFLRIELSPIEDVAESFITAWASLSLLSLSDLELTNISMAIPSTLHNLAYLELRGNRIKEITTEWQVQAQSTLSQLISLDLSANALQDGPWMLARAGFTLELSANLIESVPSTVPWSLLASRAVILDDNPLCSSVNTTSGAVCHPKCSQQCATAFISNHRCDWVCYTAACAFDGGDCASYGF